MLFIVLLVMIMAPIGLWLAYRWCVGAQQAGPMKPSSHELLSHIAASSWSEASQAASM